MKNLLLIFKLKSWVSKTMAAGGITVLLGQAILWLRSGEGMSYFAQIADWLSVTTSELTGFFITIIGVVVLILRTVTRTDLKDK